jgi:hypothetical protein
MLLDGAIAPLDLDFQVLIAEEFSAAARSARLAAFAREQLGEARKANEAALGFVPAHTTVVDGQEGVSEDQVRPDGVIVYSFELLGDLFAWILEQLRAHAPVRSGRFRDSLQLFADGALVADPGEVPPAQEYVFLSPLPYARKIEGTSGRPPESRQAPDGVFEAVAALAAQRFGNQAKIRFTFRAPLGDALVEGKLGNPLRVPAIVVTLRG